MPAENGTTTRPVFPESTSSLALARKVGFTQVGVYRRHGKREGAWKDCVIVEKLLGEATRD
jgi:phosphinothricin acetyltransferase